MNHRPSRFRPRLEALEDRSLLSVSVGYDPSSGIVTISPTDPREDTAVTIDNYGNGHIAVTVNSPAVGTGGDFFNVWNVGIRGGGPSGGLQVTYNQMGDQTYRNPSGGPSLFLVAVSPGNCVFDANFQGHALLGTVDLSVFNGGGAPLGGATVDVNAQGVNIGPFAQLAVGVNGPQAENEALSSAHLHFSMDYSGYNRGRLSVGTAGDFRSVYENLEATFLGSPSKPPFIVPVTGRTRGDSPGDLSLAALSGTDYGGDLTMLLSSPGGLSVTGVVYGGFGPTRCLRTANVKSYGCNPDSVFKSSGLVRGSALNPVLFLHP
jgi:hypothetical protein